MGLETLGWICIGAFFGSTIFSLLWGALSLVGTVVGFTIRLSLALLSGERGVERFLEIYGLDKKTIEAHKKQLDAERERLDKKRAESEAETERIKAETERLRQDNERKRAFYEESLKSTKHSKLGTDQFLQDLLDLLANRPGAVLPRWHRVLGMGESFTLEEAERSYREQMKKAHPDRGGSTQAASELNMAIEEARTFFAQYRDERA